MSLRGEWEFAVPAPELRKCAASKVEHHTERLAHYESERERLHEAFMQSVRESAEKASAEEQVVYEDYLNNLAHSHSTAGIPQPRAIQGDLDIKRQLDQAHQKIHEHRSKITTYEMWVEVLAREDQETSRTLHIDDAHFFGL